MYRGDDNVSDINRTTTLRPSVSIPGSGCRAATFEE